MILLVGLPVCKLPAEIGAPGRTRTDDYEFIPRLRDSCSC